MATEYKIDIVDEDAKQLGWAYLIFRFILPIIVYAIVAIIAIAGLIFFLVYLYNNPLYVPTNLP